MTFYSLLNIHYHCFSFLVGLYFITKCNIFVLILYYLISNRFYVCVWQMLLNLHTQFCYNLCILTAVLFSSCVFFFFK